MEQTRLNPIEEFREDHRKVRDGLLALSDAIGKGEVSQAREILGNLDTLVGPHFRYEEETLYSTLRRFLGEYMDQLLKEHDNVIDVAKTAAQLLSKETLSEEEITTGVQAARSLLVHVSNCDGLAILTEKLSGVELDELANKFSDARAAGVPLLEWADTIRNK